MLICKPSQTNQRPVELQDKLTNLHQCPYVVLHQLIVHRTGCLLAFLKCLGQSNIRIAAY